MSRQVWSKEKIIFEMKRYAELYGEAPRCKEWEHDPCYPAPGVVSYHFGSWKAAILAAGLTPRGRGAAGHREWERQFRADGKFASRHVPT